MDQRKRTLLLLSVGFLITQITFLFLVIYKGEADLGLAPFTLVPLIFLGFYLKGFSWAKWVLSIVLFLLAVVFILAGVGTEASIFYLLAIYDLFFLYSIHGFASLRSPRASVEKRKIIYPHSDYPVLLVRYKALLIDGLLLLSLMIIVMVIFDGFEYRSTVMITVGLVISFTYEPLLNSYSKTVGQRVMKIKVRSFDHPNERLSLADSYMRSFTKGTLGWLSFITINFNPHHRAIHDILGNSIVLEEKSE